MIQKLLQYLDASPVNFLAVRTLEGELKSMGFEEVDAADPLGTMTEGRKFYVKKNDSSIYAFRVGKKKASEAGFRAICAHCDSPTFRIKPNAEMTGEGGVTRLNTEVYGGAILSTWFDRPLSVAGRVIVRSDDVMHPSPRLMWAVIAYVVLLYVTFTAYMVENTGDDRAERPYVENGTYFIYYGEGAKQVAEGVFGPSLREGVCYTSEELSRKQIVPRITEVLNGN